MEQTPDSGANSEMWMVLRLPSLRFRLGWLLAGLAAGSLLAHAHVSPTALLLLLAALAGVSGNWSS
jgi:hypothetical protein